MSDITIREVIPGIWIFSKPFSKLGLPFGGRSTAIKLENGDVWVVPSTPLSTETKATLAELGPVRYLVSPDVEHHFFLEEFKKEYPEAKVIGVEGLIAKKAGTLTLDGAYGKDPIETKYGFEPEITAHYFAGFKNKDIAFLHAPSKTLITADLIFNLPGTEQYAKVNKNIKVPIFGTITPYGKVHKFLLGNLAVDATLMAKDAKIVSEWDFERIIMCHGDVIETDGKKAWVEAYSKYLT